MTAALVVTGLPGAGKTRLLRAFAARGLAVCVAPGPGSEIDARALGAASSGDVCEMHGLTWHAGGRQVTIIDAVQIAAQIEDPVVAPLLRAQIGAASAIVIGKTDLATAAPARAVISGLSDAPVFEQDLAPGDVPAAVAPPEEAIDLTPTIAHWQYRGPAPLTEAAAGQLAKARPPGVLRLKGWAVAGAQAWAIETAGRTRSVTRTEPRDETWLSAVGLSDRFRPGEMERVFAEAAASSAAASGIFGYR